MNESDTYRIRVDNKPLVDSRFVGDGWRKAMRREYRARLLEANLLAGLVASDHEIFNVLKP